MADERSTTDLVRAAQGGDARAWGELVARYAGLVIGTCRRFRLSEPEAYDVSQNVWLRLVEQLGSLREPEALPGWLATTTRHECIRILKVIDTSPVPLEDWMGAREEAELIDDLLAAERRAALRQAYASLPPTWRALLELLAATPPISYADISHRLGIPIGSIGPTRARIIERLRITPPLAALLEGEHSVRPSGKGKRQ